MICNFLVSLFQGLLLVAIFIFHGTIFCADQKVLVVILGQTRAHELTYDNMKENLIDPLHADLAVCIGVDENYDYNNPFYQFAKYKFTYQEPSDYSLAFDYVYNNFFHGNSFIKNLNWRKFLKIPGNFLGGIRNRGGSGAVLLYARWFLLKNILDQHLLDEYDFFIITRSDYIYALPHPSIDLFFSDAIYIPDGEGCGGVTDRHAVLPKKFVVKYLNIINKMATDSHNYYKKNISRKDLNLESFILFHLVEQHVAQFIKFFPYVMYTVRTEKDPTRWSSGTFDPALNYFIKYPGEYRNAIRIKTEFQRQEEPLFEFYKKRIRSIKQ